MGTGLGWNLLWVATVVLMGLVNCDNHDEDKVWRVCTGAPERGSCSDYTVRWFYNETEAACGRFWYGGCDGNENNFKTEQECTSYCKPNTKGTENIKIGVDDAEVKNTDKPQSNQAVSSQCKMDKPLQGFCTEWTVKWFYNTEKGICDRFWFGGCETTSQNLFNDEEECQKTCHKMTEEDVCSQPVVTGRCRARHQRWAYNKERRECIQFVYGGCDGNGNRFRTPEDCERTCLSGTSALGDEEKGCESTVYGCCPDRKTAARGKNNEGCPSACQSTFYGCCDDDVTPATGPNQEGCETIEITSGDEELCELSQYGCCQDGVTAATGPSNQGCPGDNQTSATATTTATPDTDITVDVAAQCKEPKDMGPCRTNPVVMWYYNSAEQGCARFWYGGCQGNSNRFKTEKECLTTCQNVVHKEPTTVPVCDQPKEIGPCRAQLPRWFYNRDSRACEQFFYGGCRGNNNNFQSQTECERYCGRGTPVSKPGSCPSVPSRGNGANCSSSCRYDGDCQGNDKCCRTSDGCSACTAPDTGLVLSASEVCSLDSSTGPCYALIPRFFYNKNTRQCESFSYGGCGGNQNNFETLDACQRYCRVRVVPVTEAPVTRPPTDRRKSPCTYAPAKGPCNRGIAKYYYDMSTMSCKTFMYGGCLGNHNNFETEAKCMQYCGLRQGTGNWKENCEMQKESGTCDGNYRRWFYDTTIGRCSEFTYSGCQGNANNFADERTCTSTCSVAGPVGPVDPVTPRPTVQPPRDEDICSLGLKPTTQCRASDAATNWYYDNIEGVCKEIDAGECNSNRNNFGSREQCEGYCNQARVCAPLTYSTPVRCLALIPRWTYDSRTGQCESFSYGGCGGSANNFETKQACDNKCNPTVVEPVTRAPEPQSRSEICALPEDTGNCLAYMRNWRYDSLTGVCVEFTYGGCGGNKNNFDTKDECERACSRQVVCQAFEEPEIACLAYYSRWRYDPVGRQCENFVYGGCGGNANNFDTFDACESKCIVEETRPDETDNRVDNRYNTWRDICNLQADVGPCRQFIRRWQYNSVSQTCEEFTYGGCLGNHNNFESKLQCMTYCDSTRIGGGDEDRVTRPPATTEAPDEVESSGEVPVTLPSTGVDVCNLESETGPCRAYLRQWYYNHLVGECQQFVYGGCRGNGNRFATKEECDAQCSPREVCLLTQASGNCMAYFPRWFFDYGEQMCKEFVYGGCDGNANNFESRENCEQRCESLKNPGPPGPAVVDKTGFCPPRTDWQGLLGACAPTCRDDAGCPGNEKCCHHGCGFRCVESVAEEPYQMDVPVRIQADAVSSDAVHLTWQDPSLGSDQQIRDSRYYTVRYHSFSLGQYNYMNVTDLRGRINGLRSDTEYEFAVRVNNPPYLSKWSESVKNKTRLIEIVKPGECPVVADVQVGICVEECQSDSNCGTNQKCCSNGCGRTCVYPQGFDICTLPTDTGSCANWEVRWFYDAAEQRCDRFWYGGCHDGNANNFMTEDECKGRCIGLVPVTTEAPRPYDCRRSLFGCCADGYTTARDAERSNCPESRKEQETIVAVTPGESAVLDCRSGANVTWYREGKLVQTNARLRVNDDGTIEVFAATIDDDGLYACHVGTFGSTTVYIYNLQVRVPIGILPGPEQIMVKPNNQAFLHCEVYGNPRPEVTWQRYNSAVQSSADHKTFPNGTLLIHHARESDQGQYTCVADNRVSQSASRTIELLIREMLVATIANDNGRVTEGDRITIKCSGTGYPQPTITWEKMGRPLESNGNVLISSGQLVIREADINDSGVYACIVANDYEKIETSTSVQVVPKSMPDDKCEDKTSLMKCRLIVTARLCGYTMYSKICCNSCLNYFVNGE